FIHRNSGIMLSFRDLYFGINQCPFSLEVQHRFLPSYRCSPVRSHQMNERTVVFNRSIHRPAYLQGERAAVLHLDQRGGQILHIKSAVPVWGPPAADTAFMRAKLSERGAVNG